MIYFPVVLSKFIGLLACSIFPSSFMMKWMHCEAGKQLETLLTFTKMRRSWLPEMKWPAVSQISSIPFLPHLKYMMGLMLYSFFKNTFLCAEDCYHIAKSPFPISFLPLAQTHQMQLFLGALWNVTLWGMSKDSGTKLSGSFQGCHTVQ